ncbi:MAG: lysostaphin resistance A-like protein [Promethearchaeota archaeon]
MRAPKEADYKTMALFFFVSLVIVVLYLVAYQIGMIQFVEVSSGGLIHRTLILNVFLMLIAVYGILVLRGTLQGEDLGLDTKKVPTALVIGLTTWLLIQLIEGILGYIYTGVIEIDYRWGTDSLGLIGLLIGMLFGTALYEEVGYRGFMLIQFRMKMESLTENKITQLILAIIISQFLFTLLHLPSKVLNQGWTTAVLFDLLFSVFLNGVIYCLLYLRTENLFFVMFVHALGNAPTSLISPHIEPSNILLLLAIIWAMIWPSLQRWEESMLSS